MHGRLGIFARRWKVIVLAAAVVTTAVAAGASIAVASTSSKPVYQKLKAGPAAHFSASSVATDTSSADLKTEIQQDIDQQEVNRSIPNAHSASNGSPQGAPQVAGNAVVAAGSDATGFDGLTHRDQRLAGTGAYTGTQFSLEPPDQALCVGGGYVLESVNTALRVRSETGTNLTAATAINQFFGLVPEIDRVNFKFGDFTSDPKCLYDPGTGRFFVTVLQLDVDFDTGAFTGRGHQLIAVSQTGDPTGAWYTYSFDATDDGLNGTPSHAGCPCFGDQPLIGADASGFYISTNEFATLGNAFNGAQVYALSKSALAAGTLPTVVHLEGGALEDGISYSLQPATTPGGGSYASANGGAEYFLSALEFTGGFDNRVAVWALSNTSTLGAASPDVHLTHSIVASEVYGAPPPAGQDQTGPAPFGQVGIKLNGFGKGSEPLSLLNSNDDRMNQVVYSNGKLWGAVNTALRASGGPLGTGIAWFAISPTSGGSATSPTVSGAIAKQGYVAVAQADVMFPAIGVNTTTGKAVMGFTLTGQHYHPSAAYVHLDATNGAGPVRVSAWGVLPADGFSGYKALGGDGVARWGDYSAAATDASGNVWFATEYIPDAPRTLFANWGTFISKVQP